MIDIRALTEMTKARLRTDEDFRAEAYMDTTGHLTIGYGWAITICPIRRAEAELRLANDVAECIAELYRAFPWFGELDVVRQSVLVNMTFNLGLGGLMKFEHTLAWVIATNWAEAAREMLASTWAKQVGQRAVRLAEMMRTGRA